MRRILVTVTTGKTNSERSEEIEVEIGATEDEIEEQAREAMFNLISWSWKDAP